MKLPDFQRDPYPALISICGIGAIAALVLLAVMPSDKRDSMLSHDVHDTPPSPVEHHQTHQFRPSTPRQYAVLVTTNLVSQPCPCGVCDPSKGIAVPEHIGVIGYDLRIVVSTNYLPIVSRP